MKFRNFQKSAGFLKSYKKICKRNPDFKNSFRKFLIDFCNNPQDKKFQMRKLKGKLNNLYAAKIEYDLRLIFYFEDNKLYLVDIGKHDQVY